MRVAMTRNNEAGPAQLAVARSDHATRTADAPAVQGIGLPPDEFEESGELGGRYVVLGTLGRGAMGVVYHAYDKAVKREVAVKVLQIANRDAQERLVEEARAMARVSNAHIVTVYDVMPIDRDGRVLLAMQYVDGTTLEQWLQEDRPSETVLEMFQQVGRGLAAVHSAGIVHRDFKPSNVLVTREGAGLVADFGLASHQVDPGSVVSDDPHETIQDGRAPGTRWYMPPEQALGLGVDPRADQYAFCVALWEALAREPLFGDVRDAAALLARKQESLPSWPRAVPLSPRIIAALYRGLSPNPQDRFPTMGELLTAIVPKRRHSQNLRVAVFASTALVASAFAWSFHLEREALCTGAEDQLRGVWDETRRDQVEASLLGTNLAYAPDTAIRVERTLDGYASGWARAHRSACEATALRGEQTSEVLDLRMGCLQRGLVDLRSAVDLLAGADVQVLQHAVDLAIALPPLERCADIEALAADVPLPRGHEDARKVELARESLARAGALELTGKFMEALDEVHEARELVADMTYAPLDAEIDYREGTLLDHLGRYAEAALAFERALYAALSGGATDVAAQAAARAAFIESHRRQKPVLGHRLAQVALGCAASSDGNPAVRGEAHNFMGTVLLGLSRLREGEAEFRRAAELRAQGLGREHPLVIDSRSNLGTALFLQGRTAEAEVVYREAVSLREEVLGAEHPRVAEAMSALAGVLKSQGRYREAEALVRRSMSVWQQTLPPHHPNIALSWNNIGFLLLRQGQFDAAARAVQEAREGFSNTAPTHRAVGYVHDNLGLIHLYRGEYHRAEAEFRRAVEFRQRVLGAEDYSVPEGRMHLGQSLHHQGRHAEANLELQAALELAQAVLGREHPTTAAISTALAQVLIDVGNTDAALQHLEHAWQIQSAGRVMPEQRADTALCLAKLLSAKDADAARAIELATQAHADYEAAGAAWKQQALEAERWLAARS